MNIWTNIIYISLPFWRLWGIKPNSYHLQSHCHVRSRCFPATVSLATNLKRPLTEDCCSMNISSVSWWNITDFIIFHKNIMKKEKSFFHCLSNLELHPLCSQTRKGSTSVFFLLFVFFACIMSCPAQDSAELSASHIGHMLFLRGCVVFLLTWKAFCLITERFEEARPSPSGVRGPPGSRRVAQTRRSDARKQRSSSRLIEFHNCLLGLFDFQLVLVNCRRICCMPRE